MCVSVEAQVGGRADAFRFQIIAGRLWVDTSLMKPPQSGPVRWFPAAVISSSTFPPLSPL